MDRIGFMTKHPVAPNLLMLMFIIGGFLMIGKMKQEVFPTFTVDVVTVSVAYPGASPREIEEGVILAIEESVTGIDGIKEVRSNAVEGLGVVTIEALIGTDMQKLTNDIKSEVDRIITFPVNAEEPNVVQIVGRRRGLDIVIAGDTDERTLHDITESIRDDLLQNSAITQLELSGVRPLEVSIEVSQENLRRYNLTLEQISNQVRSSSLDLAGGSIKTDAGEIMVRMKERRDYASEFATIPIINAEDGTRILLEDIAVIKDGYEDIDAYATFNGQKAMLITVYTTGSETPISVSKAVYKQLESIKKELPEGIHVSVQSDSSERYTERVQLLLKNSALGLILVFILLATFLEMRLAFWVMMGIPISFLGSFLFLPMLGVSLNMISLFAFIIALGIVVDDAVVVGENIYHHRQDGESRLDAAVKGSKEMAIPVTFSILTNIAAFLPLYFIPGVMGKIFAVIPLVIITVFVISLVESLFILPAHLARSKQNKPHGIMSFIHDKQQIFSHWFRHIVRDKYGPFLDTSLKYRLLTISFSIMILITIMSYVLSGRMGLSMFPKVESDFSRATVTLHFGGPFTDTQEVTQKLIETAKDVARSTGHEDEYLKGIYADIGSGTSNVAKVTVYLASADVRDRIMGTDAFTKAWREAFGEVAGLESITFRADMGGPGSGAALSIELNHKNIDILKQASRDMAVALARYPKVTDINSGFLDGKSQFDFQVSEIGQSLGLDANEISKQLRHAFYGAESIRQLRGRNELKVMVRLSEDERKSEFDLENFILRTKNGSEIPFYEAVKVEKGKSFTEINHRNGRRIILVEADMSTRGESGIIISDLEKEFIPSLLVKYPGLDVSFEGKEAEMSESMSSLKTTFILAMLAIYALLAIPFKSYTQPLIVMTAIPFGIIGAIIGHILMGYSLSVISLLGLVALTGVVVNDSLILINYANELYIKFPKKTLHDVIHEAAIQRFRPIFLTTVTTFGGLMPMLFETSRQAKFLIPMAISIGFGVLFATLITLILVPSLYLSIERRKRNQRTHELEMVD